LRGTRIVSKKPGDAWSWIGETTDSPGGIVWPSARITLVVLSPLSGRLSVKPASSTPGSARIAGKARATKLLSAASSA
jgi:hypothetical protein